MPISPEVEERLRQVLLKQISQMKIERGIDSVDSDLNLETAKAVIRSLQQTKTLVEQATDVKLIEQDKLARALAVWHDACLLSQYADANSAEYQRDLGRPGVYIIVELVNNQYVPRFVEAIPRYVGMSILLSYRLHQHATGRNSNPAKHVTDEWLQTYATSAEIDAYSNATQPEQQEIRRICIERRRLWVRTAHTENKADADRLERAMVRLYESQGIELWNKIKFATTPPLGIRHKG